MTTTQTERTEPSGETLQFMQRMWELVHALDVRSKRMVKAIGVTGPQRLVIRIIGQKPNQTASQIANTLGKHPSTLTGVLARLQERNMILREADAEDRRRARFTLTVEAAVRRAMGPTSDAHVDAMRETLNILVEELERED